MIAFIDAHRAVYGVEPMAAMTAPARVAAQLNRTGFSGGS